jgi:ABC-type spermidine/putrescine transport system permease subunit II
MTLGERIVLTILGLVTLTVFAVLYAPVAISALFSLVDLDHGTIDWAHPTLHWYGDLAGNGSVLSALGNTAIAACGAVVAALVLACAIAIYAQREDAILPGVIEFVVFLPFLLPPIITGLSLLITFDELGIQRNIVTITIGHAVFVLALVYRTILVRLKSMSRSWFEASGDLGASSIQTFRYVTLPQLKSALITAALLALTLSFDETLITIFLCGDTSTLPIRLWAMMRVGFTPEINALVTLVLLASICMAVVASVLMKPKHESTE